MARNLILHIGLPKTGSSAIQHYLTQRRRALLRHGVHYPPTPGGSNHSALSLAVNVKDRPLLWLKEVTEKGLAAPPRIEDFWRSFDDDMKSAPPEASTVILSAERFGVQLNSPAKIASLHELLTPFFDNIRVVAYLRRQDAHATSAYSQLLRFGIITEPGLEQPKSRYNKFYDYAELLEDWGAVFGPAAIEPRIFERASLRDGDVVRDFLHVCGLNLAKLPEPTPEPRNPSINLLGQSVLVAMGKLLQEQTGKARITDKVWDMLTNLVSETCAGQGWRPCRAEARAFMQGYAASNEVVRQRWFPDRAALFDLKDSDLPEEPMRLDTSPQLAVASGIVLEAVRRTLRAESDARLSRAQLAMATGQDRKAGALLQKAVQLNGGNVGARMALAKHMAEAGETKTAVAHARAALTARPENKAVQKFLRELEKTGK